MTGRALVERFLVRLYPERWRKEYGEEMRAMLLSQHTGAAAFCNVLVHAVGENFRHPPDLARLFAVLLICRRCFWILRYPAEPLSRQVLSIVADIVFYRVVQRYLRLPGPWKSGAALLICWRCFWTFWGPAQLLSPNAASVVSDFDFGVFMATGFGIAWMTARREVSFSRGGQNSLLALGCGMLLPVLLDLAASLAGLRSQGMDPTGFDEFSLSAIAHYVFILSAVCWGALLGRYLRLESQ